MLKKMAYHSYRYYVRDNSNDEKYHRVWVKFFSVNG